MAEERRYEVRINSFKLVDALGVTAVHNEIAFYEDGKIIFSLNGNAHDPQTGEFKQFAIASDHTLRVSAYNKSLEQLNMELAGSVTLDKLSRQEFFEKVNAATTAGKFINDNKIDYVILGGLNHEAQNSNSVATSLLHSMGYAYPEKELAHLWAPGSKRNLLPDDWSTNDNAPTGTIIEQANDLDPVRVKATIRDERRPQTIVSESENLFPNLFNPNETTVPYVKKEQIPSGMIMFSSNPKMETPDESEDPLNESLANEEIESEINAEEETNEAEPAVGFHSSAEPMIQTGQKLTSSFAVATANPPVQPPPGQDIEMTDPPLQQKAAQNSPSYLTTGTSGP